VRNILISVPDKKEKHPLAVTHPELAKEADGWDPTKISLGSHKRLKWKCKKGHTWIAPVLNRTNGSGCGICANKVLLSGYNDLATRYPEFAMEAYGWDPKTVISGTKKVTWKCKKGHLWDAPISSRISGSGCAVCSNMQVLSGFNDLFSKHPSLAEQALGWDPNLVIAGTNKKYGWKCGLGHSWQASPASRIAGNGCPVCANKVVLEGFNDLATTHPEIAIYANGWDPSKIVAGSNKVFSWKCKKGHVWERRAIEMFNGQRCAVCLGRKLLIGYNDLATTHPELIIEVDGWDPQTVSFGTMNKKRWICNVGHRWTSSVNDRAMGSGCPTCATYGFDPNSKAFLYFIHQPSWQMLQIGITNFPERRIGTHKKLGWELLELRGPMDGHLTQQWETAILRMLKAKGADLSNSKIAGKFDGYSEAWSRSTFEAKSIKDLLRLAEEFEEK